MKALATYIILTIPLSQIDVVNTHILPTMEHSQACGGNHYGDVECFD